MENELISRSTLLGKAVRVTEYDEAGFSMTYRAVPETEILSAPAVDAVERKKLVKKLFPMGVPKTREEWDYSINARAVYEAIMRTEGD
jgi:hypothetical protein